MQDADAALYLVSRMLLTTDCRGQALEQRIEVRTKQAGFEIFQQLLHRQQRVDLLRAEPQAGKLLNLRLRIVAVAVGLAIPHDGNIQPRAQIFQIALEGGGRDLEFLAKSSRRHDLLAVNELLDLVEAFGAVHARIVLADEGKRLDLPIRGRTPDENRLHA